MPTDEPEITCDMAARRRASELAAAYECRIRAEAESRCRAQGRTTITVSDVERAAASQPQDVAELREALARHAETTAAAVESAGKHGERVAELEQFQREANELVGGMLSMKFVQGEANGRPAWFLVSKEVVKG